MRQNLPIILGALVIFAAVSGIIVHFMPEPVEDTDYLIAGSAGTLRHAVLVSGGSEAVETAAGADDATHVTFLLNFADELRRKTDRP